RRGGAAGGGSFERPMSNSIQTIFGWKSEPGGLGDRTQQNRAPVVAVLNTSIKGEIRNEQETFGCRGRTSRRGRCDGAGSAAPEPDLHRALRSAAQPHGRAEK